MNKLSMNPEKKKVAIIILVVAVVIFLFIFLFSLLKKEGTPAVYSPEGLPTGDMLADEEMRATGEAPLEEVPEVLQGAEMLIEGVDLISKEGKVITTEGKEVRADVRYDSALAPKQSLAMSQEDIEQVKGKTINLEIGDGLFSPSTFSVKKGEAVSLTMTGTDTAHHVFRFIDPSLQAVYININSGETRMVVFNAPDTAGEYSFRCDFPGHFSKGEEGIMIVK